VKFAADFGDDLAEDVGQDEGAKFAQNGGHSCCCKVKS
jgi:hypothetical protein